MKYFFIDNTDLAQELTDKAVLELAEKHGKDLLKYVFLERFTETEGLTYISIDEMIEKI